MLFTLIHYTTGWDKGVTLDLKATPTVGSLVSTMDFENDDSIFYVDNLLFTEAGNYLFVRPYEGYGSTAPLTESDRTRQAIERLQAQTERNSDTLRKELERRIDLLRNDTADLISSTDDLTKAVDNLSDNLLEELRRRE